MNWKNYAKELEDIISRINLPESTKILLAGLQEIVRKRNEDGITRYIMVDWPEYSRYIDGPKHDECIRIDGEHYMIPEELYDEVSTLMKQNLS